VQEQGHQQEVQEQEQEEVQEQEPQIFLLLLPQQPFPYRSPILQ